MGSVEFFISPSSVGYAFSWTVSFINAYILLRKYKKNKLPTLRVFGLSWIFLGGTMFFYGAPPFLFSKSPEVLGWFNVIGNISVLFWHAYIGVFLFHINGWEAHAKKIWWVLVAWGFLVATPLNILYMPMPYFDKFGIEIWSYPLPVFIAVNGISQTLMILMAISLYKKISTSAMKLQTFLLGTAFGIGGIGASFITGGFTTIHVVIGYILMFVGGFTLFLFVYGDWYGSHVLAISDDPY